MITFNITASTMRVKCKRVVLGREIPYLEVQVPRYVLAFLMRLYTYCPRFDSFKEMLYRILEDCSNKPYEEWDEEIKEFVPEAWSRSFLGWLDEVHVRLEFVVSARVR